MSSDTADINTGGTIPITVSVSPDGGRPTATDPTDVSPDLGRSSWCGPVDTVPGLPPHRRSLRTVPEPPDTCVGGTLGCAGTAVDAAHARWQHHCWKCGMCAPFCRLCLRPMAPALGDTTCCAGRFVLAGHPHRPDTATVQTCRDYGVCPAAVEEAAIVHEGSAIGDLTLTRATIFRAVAAMAPLMLGRSSVNASATDAGRAELKIPDDHSAAAAAAFEQWWAVILASPTTTIAARRTAPANGSSSDSLRRNGKRSRSPTPCEPRHLASRRLSASARGSHATTVHGVARTDLECGICFEVAAAATQTTCCGALWCGPCIHNVGSGSNPACPHCRADNPCAVPDTFRERLAQQVVCACAEPGCHFAARRDEYRQHMADAHGVRWGAVDASSSSDDEEEEEEEEDNEEGDEENEEDDEDDEVGQDNEDDDDDANNTDDDDDDDDGEEDDDDDAQDEEEEEEEEEEMDEQVAFDRAWARMSVGDQIRWAARHRRERRAWAVMYRDQDLSSSEGYEEDAILSREDIELIRAARFRRARNRYLRHMSRRDYSKSSDEDSAAKTPVDKDSEEDGEDNEEANEEDGDQEEDEEGADDSDDEEADDEEDEEDNDDDAEEGEEEEGEEDEGDEQEEEEDEE